jgi:hypothetical protein
VTTLRILAEVFEVELHRQVLDVAIGMHGAGGYRAQCGLVEGALMFIGLFGKAHARTADEIAQTCYNFAETFEDRFGSLLCREGFAPDNPPHLCEDLSRRVILFAIEFLNRGLSGRMWNERATDPPLRGEDCEQSGMIRR